MMQWPRWGIGAIALAWVGGPLSLPQQGKDYRSALAAALAEVIETDSVRIDSLDLGPARPGSNTFRATIHNQLNQPLAIGLDLRTTPGLWLRGNWERGYRFDLTPGEARRIEVEYQFLRLSPEGTLRVRFGQPAGQPPNVVLTALFFEQRYELGGGNPTASDPRPAFTLLKTQHLDLYARRGSLAEHGLDRIGRQRETALRRIAEILGVEVKDRIRLVFYPDSATKTSETGHIGAGFASGTTIVEIYNRDLQLDPYHELAHVVANQLGAPPALFNEGFAVYASEHLGADALKYLGSPGKSVDVAMCGLPRAGKAIALDSLFAFTEIGSETSRPTIAYSEAASFVKYLIEGRGLERFRETYRTLMSTDDTAGVRRNREEFHHIYGGDVALVGREWRRKLGC